MRKALIELFKRPVPATSEVERKVLTRLMGNPDIDFDQPILDLQNNVHLSVMARLRGDIVTPVVWESTNGEDAKTVLHSFKTTGQ